MRRLQGTRVQFTGSASVDANPENLKYSHELIRRLAKRIVVEGGGLVVGLGSEPMHGNGSNLPIIFDWTIIEGFIDGSITSSRSEWPNAAGQQLVAVGFTNWKDKIPRHRKELWTRAVETGKVRLIQLPPGFNIGGVMREVQASFGDILMVIGGAPGAHHSVSIYLSQHKPIVPFDISMGPVSGGQREGERLATIAVQNPHLYFQLDPEEDGSATYSTRLSFKDGLVPIEKFQSSMIAFISQMKPPQAFLAHIQDSDNRDFPQVQRFFHTIVEPVVTDLGYRKFEVGIDSSEERFLNVEIFKQIDLSSLLVVDLTGLRPNCLMELGYAFGLGKKVIICAMKGTTLPFDTSAIPCHFWSIGHSESESRDSLSNFMNVNVGRGPLVKEQSFLTQPLI